MRPGPHSEFRVQCQNQPLVWQGFYLQEVCTPTRSAPKLRTVCDVGRLVSKLMTFGFLASLLSWSSTSIPMSSSSSFSTAKGQYQKRKTRCVAMSDAGSPSNAKPLREPGGSPVGECLQHHREAPRLGWAPDHSTSGQWKIYRRAAKTAQSVPHAARRTRFPVVGFLHTVRHTRHIGGTGAGS